MLDAWIIEEISRQEKPVEDAQLELPLELPEVPPEEEDSSSQVVVLHLQHPLPSILELHALDQVVIHLSISLHDAFHGKMEHCILDNRI